MASRRGSRKRRRRRSKSRSRRRTKSRRRRSPKGKRTLSIKKYKRLRPHRSLKQTKRSEFVPLTRSRAYKLLKKKIKRLNDEYFRLEELRKKGTRRNDDYFLVISGIELKKMDIQDMMRILYNHKPALPTARRIPARAPPSKSKFQVEKFAYERTPFPMSFRMMNELPLIRKDRRDEILRVSGLPLQMSKLVRGYDSTVLG